MASEMRYRIDAFEQDAKRIAEAFGCMKDSALIANYAVRCLERAINHDRTTAGFEPQKRVYFSDID